MGRSPELTGWLVDLSPSVKLVVVNELYRLRAADATLVVRRAVLEDVAAIVDLIAADQIAAERDGGDLEPYMSAFAEIDADPAQLLVVVTDARGAVVGTLQLTFIPGLARHGARRAQIEAVRVRADFRGRGIGHQLVGWAIQEARHRGCALVQLTSDKRRQDAHRLYGRLGFTPSHDGFKLRLPDVPTN